MSLSLSRLTVFPVKSARGIAVESWELGPRGLALDRHFMVVDPEGRFVSQREEPRLSLIDTGLEAGWMTLRAPGLEPLRVALAAPAGERLPVEIWTDRVGAEPVGEEADSWLTRHLGSPVRLVRFPDDAERQVDLAYARAGDQVAFPDAFSLLLVSEASLADLNQRLARPISMDRFRPNLVVRGCEPFAEDGWRRIRIGEIELDVVKPCARCTVTTVDPATGETGVEPLRTLATFRRRDGKVMFGQNLVHRGTGTLRTGQAVAVLA